jgi:hypothetical protein
VKIRESIWEDRNGKQGQKERKETQAAEGKEAGRKEIGK